MSPRSMAWIAIVLVVACGGNPPPPRATPPIATIDAGVSVIDADIALRTPSPGRHPTVPSAPTADPAKPIRDAIAKRRDRVLDCYQKLSPNAFPPIRLELTIGPDGRVRNASATGAERALDDCVVAVFQATQFPQPSGGGSITVTYPFNFDPIAGP